MQFRHSPWPSLPDHLANYPASPENDSTPATCGRPMPHKARLFGLVLVPLFAAARQDSDGGTGWSALLRLHDTDGHSVFQFHVARQGHLIALDQPAEDFVVRRAGDPHANLALLELAAVYPQSIVCNHVYVAVCAVNLHRSARYGQHADSLPRIDPYIHIDVGQQLELLVIHGAEQFAHASRS